MNTFPLKAPQPQKSPKLQLALTAGFWLCAGIGFVLSWEKTYLLTLLAIAFSVQAVLVRFMPTRTPYRLLVGEENLILEEGNATLWQLPLEQITDIAEEQGHFQHIETDGEGRVWFVYTNSGEKYSIAGRFNKHLATAVMQAIKDKREH